MLVFLLFVVPLVAVNTPITTCQQGRHTIFCSGAACDGGCGIRDLTQGVGPGHRRIFAPNFFLGSGFGWRNSSSCGVCYQVTGIAASTIAMVSTSCPDCPTLQAHFDMSQEAATIIDGGSGQPGMGNTAVSWREVSCGYSGNVLVEVNDLTLCCGSSNPQYFMRLTVGRHNIRLGTRIRLQENGKAAKDYERTTYGVWDFNPNGGTFAFPISATLWSYDDQAITFSITSNTPLIIDTGSQFAEPTAVGPSCTECSKPFINNGQDVIYDDGVYFPQRIGSPYEPVTSAAWEAYGTKFSASTAVAPYGTNTRSGAITVAAWGTISNIGCNVALPKSQVVSIQFALRTQDGATGDAQVRFGATGTFATLSPVPNATWQVYTIPISSNSNVPDPLSNIYMQAKSLSGATTFYISSFKFIFESNSDQCTPWRGTGGCIGCTGGGGAGGGGGGGGSALTTSITLAAVSILFVASLL